MGRKSKEEKMEMDFFTNKKGEIQYHKHCLDCKRNCKQSFRCIQIICPKFEK